MLWLRDVKGGGELESEESELHFLGKRRVVAHLTWPSCPPSPFCVLLTRMAGMFMIGVVMACAVFGGMVSVIETEAKEACLHQCPVR